MADQVRWFDPLGLCAGGCGKPATGVLRGPRNESYGRYCGKCAERRLAKAECEREIRGAPRGPIRWRAGGLEAEKFRRLWLDGKKITEMAEEFLIDERNVYRVRKMLGLSSRRVPTVSP